MDKTTFEDQIFWGTSENAVRVQLYSAIIASYLVAIVSEDLKTGRSTYETLQVISISLLDKTPVNELLKKNRLQRCQRTKL